MSSKTCLNRPRKESPNYTVNPRVHTLSLFHSFTSALFYPPPSAHTPTHAIPSLHCPKGIPVLPRHPCPSRGPALRINPAVPSFSVLKIQQRLQQPRAVEIRPQRLRHKNFRVGDLPQQEIAHPHLPARSDQ